MSSPLQIGTLHFWDVTIDVIVCVNIVLACGLCVDYSVHIAHSFSVAEGEAYFVQVEEKSYHDSSQARQRKGLKMPWSPLALP